MIKRSRSNLQDIIFKVENVWHDEIIKVNEMYSNEINKLKNRCTHKWDDGSDATHEERNGYNNYEIICEICGRRVG